MFTFDSCHGARTGRIYRLETDGRRWVESHILHFEALLRVVVLYVTFNKCPLSTPSVIRD